VAQGLALSLGEALGPWRNVVLDVVSVLEAYGLDDEYLRDLNARLMSSGLPGRMFESARAVLGLAGEQRWSATRLHQELANALDPETPFVQVALTAAAEPADAPGQSAASIARMVARTEATGAYGHATLRTMQAFGQATKRWVAAHDSHTRPTHAHVDGQEIPTDMNFLVGASVMMYPGDPRAPLSETANCRCVLVAVKPKKGAQRPQVALRPSMTLRAVLDSGDASQELQAELDGAATRALSSRGLTFEVQGLTNNTRVGSASYVVRLRDKNGKVQGTIKRRFRTRQDGSIVAYHAQFELSRAYQGQGIATSFNREMEVLYRKWGVSEITLDANIDVGGYTWAKAGYDWDPHWVGGSVEVLRILGKLAAGGTDVSDWIALVTSEPMDLWPLPYDIAMKGYTDGATSWPGKQAMLGSAWGGRKKL
jgi:hypothetical protein